MALDQCSIMAIYRLPLPADGGGPILHHLRSMTRSVPTWDTSRVFVTHAFVPYCGLVLFFLAITGLATVVIPRLFTWSYLRSAAQLYLLLALANGIGRFYWQNRERLDWGV